MFATPRQESSASSARFRCSRRTLDLNSSGHTSQLQSTSGSRSISDEESPVQASQDSEMLNILRDLQRQVSNLQAQQNRERTSSAPSATTPSCASENLENLQ